MEREWTIEHSLVAEPPARAAGIVYPDSDGEKMAENNFQQRAIRYATGALRAHFRNRSHVHVRGDMFIFYRNGEPEVQIVPDVFVVFGDVVVPQTSYRVWETGVVPQFVMEVASKSTYLRDRDDKIGTYEGMGVLEYWRFDPTGELFRPPELGRCVWGSASGREGATKRSSRAPRDGRAARCWNWMSAMWRDGSASRTTSRAESCCLTRRNAGTGNRLSGRRMTNGDCASRPRVELERPNAKRRVSGGDEGLPRPRQQGSESW